MDNPTPAKIEVLKIEKIGELFNNLDDQCVRSIVAIKSNKDPVVHLVAVPHALAERMAAMCLLFGIKATYVEVTPDDFGEMGSAGNA